MTDKAQKERLIEVSRTFDAPRDLVFEAFTKADIISRWWGPNGFSTTTESMKFEVGGEWIFMMHGPDGTDYPNRIVYTLIEKPERLEYDHYGHKDEWGDPPHFKATVTFEQLEEKSRVTLRLLFPTARARNEAVDFGAVQGGEQTLGRLVNYLSEKL